MYVTVYDLEQLRGLLIVGWMGTWVLLLLVNLPDKWPPVPKKSKAVEFCKLHSRPLTECKAQHEESK